MSFVNLSLGLLVKIFDKTYRPSLSEGRYRANLNNYKEIKNNNNVPKVLKDEILQLATLKTLLSPSHAMMDDTVGTFILYAFLSHTGFTILATLAFGTRSDSVKIFLGDLHIFLGCVRRTGW